jgi:hypothetical protein
MDIKSKSSWRLLLRVTRDMTLEDLLEQIQIEVLTEASLADQKLVKEMSVEITLVTQGLTVKQRRMLFQILHRFYELIERLAE